MEIEFSEKDGYKIERRGRFGDWRTVIVIDPDGVCYTLIVEDKLTDDEIIELAKERRNLLSKWSDYLS